MWKLGHPIDDETELYQLGEGTGLAVVLGMAFIISSRVKLLHTLQKECTR